MSFPKPCWTDQTPWQAFFPFGEKVWPWHLGQAKGSGVHNSLGGEIQWIRDPSLQSWECSKGSGTSLLSTWPLFPMQDILFTVTCRKCDNRYFLRDTQWRTQQSAWQRRLVTLTLCPFLFHKDIWMLGDDFFFLNTLEKKTTWSLVFQFSGFPWTAKFANT